MRMWQVMDMEILLNDILQERSWVVYSLIPRVGGLCSKSKTEIHKCISSTFEDNDLSANAYFYYKIRKVQCIAPFFAWKFICEVFLIYVKLYNWNQYALQNITYVSLRLRVQNRRKNGISRLISALCVNCLISIPEYSRIIDYSIIWMCIWCGLLQKLYKIKKSELLNSKVYSKV